MASTSDIGQRVAVIRNYVLDGDWGHQMLHSIENMVHQSHPRASVQHYALIDGGDAPDASAYDLVILTGGVWDLSRPESKFEPWVTKIVAWVKDTVVGSPSTKLLGICWGHQVISYALGGTVKFLQDGIMIGVREVALTALGSDLFGGVASVRLHKFHKRIVTTAPPGFYDLAENHEIMLSNSNKIMTFQRHPEMTVQISLGLVDHGDQSDLPDASAAGIVKLRNTIEGAEDGKIIWPMIMRWALGQD